MCEPKVSVLAARLWDVFREQFMEMKPEFFAKTFDQLQPDARFVWMKMGSAALAEFLIAKARSAPTREEEV